MARSSRPQSSNTAAVVGTVLVLTVLYLARDVLIPIAAAILFTFVLAPMTRRLQRRGLGRVPSAALVVLVMLAAVGSVAWTVGGQLFDLAANVPQYKQNIKTKISTMRQSGGSMFSKVGEGVQEMQEMLEGEKSNTPQPVKVSVVAPPPSLLETLRSMVGPLLGPVMDTGIVVVFLLFMLIQREDLRDRLIRLLGQGRLSVTTQALDDAAKRVSAYLLAQVIINTGCGVIVALGLSVIGVPNALLWGLIAGVLRFIPYLGPWIALTMPLAVSFAVSPSWTMPLSVLGFFAVLELITNNVVEPMMYGQGTGLSEIAVIISAVFWTWMWGPVGLILATPLTVCLVVISRYVPQLEFLGVLLGDERALSPDANFYQRLLAMDQVEAAEVVDTYLTDHTLIEAYENVVIPALTLAEEDRHQGSLSEEREQFIVQSVRELVDDLSERHVEPKSMRIGRVVCLPARDEADATAARMMAQLIEAHGPTATAVSHELLSGEMLDLIARERADVIVISAIPPYAVMYANYLVKRVRRRFPDTTVVVGLWGVSGATSAGYKRLATVSGDKMAVKLSDALTLVLAALPEPAALTEEENLPADEEARVNDLTALSLIDTDPEPAFDQIVQGLAGSLTMPMAFIALVDGKREWWKAHTGLPEKLATERSLGRAGSLAARVVATREPLMIPDSRRDPRASASPMMRATGAQCFAGVPLLTEGKHVIGALCVADVRPRVLSPAERETMKLVAEHVMTQIRLRSALERAVATEVRADARAPSEIVETARTLQRRIMPATAVTVEGCRVDHVHRDAADGVTGFLDVITRADGQILVLIADTMAEPAASLVVAAALKTSFQRVGETVEGPSELLRALEQDLSRVVQKQEQVSATVALINVKERTVLVASAGHPAPLKLTADGVEPLEIVSTDPLLTGARGRISTIEPVKLALGVDERLLLPGDGAVEVEDEKGQLLGARGFAALVNERRTHESADLLQELVTAVDERAGKGARTDLVLALIAFPKA